MAKSKPENGNGNPKTKDVATATTDDQKITQAMQDDEKITQAMQDWDDESDEELDGWYRPEDNVGRWIVGTIVGQLQFEDKRGELRRSLLLKLATAAIATVEREPTTLAPGHIIAIGFRYKLSNLFDLENGSRVGIKAVEEIQLRNEQSMWKFRKRIDPSTKRLRAVATVGQLVEPKRPGLGDRDEATIDDLPF